MRAVVLVGGFGTRLRPLTDGIPKQMLPVGHSPMIEHVVSYLASYGIEQVILSMGFRPEVFEGAYPEGQCLNIPLQYTIESEPLDTAGAIRYAIDQNGIDETFLVFNGDVLTDLNIDQLVTSHRSSGAMATIALTRVTDPGKYGVVSVDKSGKVCGFVEKPPSGEEPSNFINAGVYVLEPASLLRISSGVSASIERQVFPEMCLEGSLFAKVFDGYWIDAGTPETYLAANIDLIGGNCRRTVDPIHYRAYVDRFARVEKSVIGDSARIAAGAEVTNSLVMAGASIGEGARVDQSIVASGAVVSNGAEVTGLTVLGFETFVSSNEKLDGAKRPAIEDQV